MSIGQKIYQYAVIDSTNTQAKRLGAEGAPHGSVVVAKRQTAGRGRRGRAWESEKEGNLYFSLVLKPNLPVEKASMLTLVMAQAVAEAIREVCGVTAGIKWPNDIVLEGKKAVGILTELDLDQGGEYRVIVGVGVNVVKQDFDAELAQKAISLEEIVGKNPEKKLCKPAHRTDTLGQKLLSAILRHFETLYELFLQEGNLKSLQENYNSRLVNKDRVVRVLEPGDEYLGLALGINEEGELLVAPCDADGKPDEMHIKKVYAGEVSVRGIYGYV